MTATARPAEIGMALEEIDTPALLLDLDAFEYNLARMVAEIRPTGLTLRPHGKAHKCAEIARRQIALGAVGVCCQKVSEAEAFVDAGILNVVVTNEVIAAPKLDRLTALARRAVIAVCVDDPAVLPALNTAAGRAGVVLDVLVEIDVGGARCGQLPGEPAARLAESVARTRHLRLRGLQAYQGRAQHIRPFEERRAAIERAAEMVRQTVAKLHARNLPCEVVGGAGTGTYAFEAASGAYTELQPGSYIFMDGDYAQDLDESGKRVSGYQHSLFVYTQVMSAPGRGLAIVDAGLKAIAFDSGMPWVAGRPEVPYTRPSDEHGVLDVRNASTGFELGTKLKLIPGHCDPTVNLYDWYVCIRNGRVESLWPVTARGAIS
jgi:D-serine deaminase-like pyridoxal phosphate-dependent protein